MESIVNLDIGGQMFRSRKGTLCSIDGYFAEMFRSGTWSEAEDANAAIFIDRDPFVFGSVLSYLRSHRVVFSPQQDDAYLQQLLIEADYYRYEELSRAVESELESRLKVKDSTGPSALQYRFVQEHEAGRWLSQGWAFVSQFSGNESRACPLDISYRVAGLVENRCTVCHETMYFDRFIKHCVIFKPSIVVISKKSTVRETRSDSAVDASDAPILQFDQSFG